MNCKYSILDSRPNYPGTRYSTLETLITYSRVDLFLSRPRRFSRPETGMQICILRQTGHFSDGKNKTFLLLVVVEKSFYFCLFCKKVLSFIPSFVVLWELLSLHYFCLEKQTEKNVFQSFVLNVICHLNQLSREDKLDCEDHGANDIVKIIRTVRAAKCEHFG
jgi:hypothetical protein